MTIRVADFQWRELAWPSRYIRCEGAGRIVARGQSLEAAARN